MTESVVDYSEQLLAVEVDDVTMIFNMASESLTYQPQGVLHQACQARAVL